MLKLVLATLANRKRARGMTEREQLTADEEWLKKRNLWRFTNKRGRLQEEGIKRNGPSGMDQENQIKRNRSRGTD
jgi:hypothetical protein